ncbi:hypothetical protein BDF19DRAFT_454318 [Syncephalis fuscata]|nr:hypothetical protein BDF19DRAFT_454318 [Syncephalis fuscata]
MAPEANSKALFPNAMGSAIREMHNVNRDKQRSIRITIENHHSTLRLSGARFDCQGSSCKEVPSHVVDSCHEQTTQIVSVMPNTACSGYIIYRMLDHAPALPHEMELFVLIIWDVPIVGTNRYLLEILQASPGTHLLRQDNTVQEIIDYRRSHRLMAATHAQSQGWSVADKAFMAIAAMTNTINAKLELRITNVPDGSSKLLDAPEHVQSTGESIDWGFNIDPISPKPVLRNDSCCGMLKRANMVVQLNNQTDRMYLKNARLCIKEGNSIAHTFHDVAPQDQVLIPFTAHRKLKGCLVYEITTQQAVKADAIAVDTAAAYRNHCLFLLIAWSTHPRKGNRLCVDVVRARCDIFPGTDQQLSQFYDAYIRYLLGSTTRPSIWQLTNGDRIKITSFIDAGLHDVVLLLDIGNVTFDLARAEAPLFLPNLGIGVTMNNSLADVTERFAQRAHWKQQQLLLIVENTHHNLTLTPIWPIENIDQQISQGRHELKMLNRARLHWATEGIRIYQIIMRNSKTASPNIIYFLVVRARDTELSVGIMAAWASAYLESSIDMDSIVNCVRMVPNMARLPMARHIQQDIQLNNGTAFQLTAFRNPTMPFTLTLTIGHASSNQIQNWPEQRTFAIPAAGLWRPLQGHINSPIPPQLRVTMLNDESGLQLGHSQVFSVGYQLAAIPEKTQLPITKLVFNFKSLPANEERSIYIFHTLLDTFSAFKIWFSVQARGDLLSFHAKCRLDEQEMATLESTMSRSMCTTTALPGNDQSNNSVAVFSQPDGQAFYVALCIGRNLNGNRTELIICCADQREKVEACVQASNEHLRSSVMEVQE